MVRFFIYFFALLFSFSVASPSDMPETVLVESTEYVSFIPNKADDAFEYVLEESPLTYIIFIGLVLAIGSLSLVLRVLWYKNVELLEQKDNLQEEKLTVALSSTETIKEAIDLVQKIHESVTKLTDSDLDRRITDVEIKNQLNEISTKINKLNEVISKI